MTYIIVYPNDGNDCIQIGDGNAAVCSQEGNDLVPGGAWNRAIRAVGRQGRTMLILDKARLVLLEMPKTASQALRQTLKSHVRDLSGEHRHGGYRAFKRHLYPALAKEWDGTVECCCVVREPLAQMQSWYRYRQRAEIAGTEKSSAGIDFEAYIEALLSEEPPPFVQTGRQAMFTCWDGAETKVDHVFDYQRLDSLLAFLGGRLCTQLQLPRRNQSTGPMPPQLQARFAAAYAEDYALYQAVQKAGGHLQRGALDGPQLALKA